MAIKRIIDESRPANRSVWRVGFSALRGSVAMAFVLAGTLNLYAQSSPLTVQPSTGRVGVGTTNPGYTVDVNGTVNATSFRGDGSQLSNVAGALMDKVTTDAVIGNTTTETNLYSFSVPGGTFGTSTTLRLTLRGRITGASSHMTFRVKYGATTLSAGLVISTGMAGASNLPWMVVVEMSADGTASAQVMHALGSLQHIPPGEESTPSWQNNGYNTVRIVRGTSAIDSSVAQNLVVTGKWNAASGNSIT